MSRILPNRRRDDRGKKCWPELEREGQNDLK